MSVGEKKNQRYQSIKIAVIIPAAFIEQENVPVSRTEDKARCLKLIPESYS